MGGVRGNDHVGPHQYPRGILDGHDLCRWISDGPEGRAGAALSVAAIGSWIAGTISVVLLMSFAPALANFALRFGRPSTSV